MILEFIKSENFLIVIVALNILLIILYICNLFKLRKLNKNYNLFMKKLGKGHNIEEILKDYLDKVVGVEEQNKEIIKQCNRLEKNISLCISKIGIVRYSAFKDTGSDLSFALALLNDENDGVILNGIYSREMSNIYAKQIVKGKPSNKLSEEENSALETAISQIK